RSSTPRGRTRSRRSSARGLHRRSIGTGSGADSGGSSRVAVAERSGRARLPGDGIATGRACVDEVLARAGLFQGVAPEASEALAESLTYSDHARGDTVFAEGELGDTLYI